MNSTYRHRRTLKNENKQESKTPFLDETLSTKSLPQTNTSHVGISTNISMKVLLLPKVSPSVLIFNSIINPSITLLTLITNLMVCVVLLKKNMINATNAVLVSIAISDTLTGLLPLPIYVYFYSLENYKDYVPFQACYIYETLMSTLPTVFHTSSIWLTVVLSLQRYLFVCHNQIAKRVCSMKNCLQAIISIFFLALLMHALRFFESDYKRVEVASLVQPNTTITSCKIELKEILEQNESLIYTSYWVSRVVLVHLIPCSLLIILNSLLLTAMKAATRRREQLFKQNRRTESKRLAESNVATLMLVIVVGVFLAVECPLALLLVIYLYDNISCNNLISPDSREFATFIINFFILLSYPFNFFIYCTMSRQFRTTFTKLFHCNECFNKLLACCSVRAERGLDEAEALSMNTLTKQSLLTNKNNHKITIPKNVVMVDEMQNCMKKWESNTVDDAEVKNDRKTN